MEKQQKNVNSACFHCGAPDGKLNHISQLKCGHIYCHLCLGNYLKASIASRKLPLTCVHPDCKKLIFIEELVDIFGVKMMEKFFEFARNSNNFSSYNNNNNNMNGMNGQMKSRCLNPKCGRILRNDELALNECPSCFQRIARYNGSCICGEGDPCSKCNGSYYPVLPYQHAFNSGQPLDSSMYSNKRTNNSNSFFSANSSPFYPSSSSAAPSYPYSYPQNHFSYFSSSVSNTLFGINAPTPSHSHVNNVNTANSVNNVDNIWKPFPSSPHSHPLSSSSSSVPTSNYLQWSNYARMSDGIQKHSSLFSEPPSYPSTVNNSSYRSLRTSNFAAFSSPFQLDSQVTPLSYSM